VEALVNLVRRDSFIYHVDVGPKRDDDKAIIQDEEVRLTLIQDRAKKTNT
jgi:hypothetical protein